MAAIFLDIAEVASRSGLAPSALRYYERKGLIESSGRNGLRRTYLPSVMDRLALIDCAKRAGFSLAQVGRFLVSTPSDKRIRGEMAARAVQLDEEIDRLQRMRDSLKHAAVCTHTPLVECPKFKAAIRV
jgi:DNA-binding transcriptional MerR regulator